MVSEKRKLSSHLPVSNPKAVELLRVFFEGRTETTFAANFDYFCILVVSIRRTNTAYSTT
jgi:hypothetical protein